MKIFRLFVALLICVLPDNLYAKSGHQGKPYFFIQLSDPQFGFFAKNKGFEKETALYEKAVEAINKLKPDFVVITGDFVNDHNDIAQITEFKRITRKISPGIPVYLTPGNHDLSNKPDSLTIHHYMENYGYSRFSFNHNKSLFVGFDSNLIKASVPFYEQNQYEWLERTLAKSKKYRQVILFCHHPFFLNSFDEKETYTTISLENRKKYFDLFEASHVKAILSGHSHSNALSLYHDIQMINTSSVGKPLGKDISGLRIVKVLDDKIESFYYGLEEIPESISLIE